MTDTNKCYTCKFRRNVPGSVHSSCVKMSVVDALFSTNEDTRPKFNSHGIQRGWVSWPLNFDPVWLESCNFYQEVNTLD